MWLFEKIILTWSPYIREKFMIQIFIRTRSFPIKLEVS